MVWLMFDHVLRLLKDRWLAPLARWLGPSLSPNTVSVLGFLFGLACAAAAARGANVLAVVLWVVNRMLDGLDGSLARVHGRQTDFGGYLDILLDFVVYAAIPVAMVYASPSRDIAVAGVLLLATFFVNSASWMYLAAILERRELGATTHGELTTVTMPPGLIAGTETVVFYALFLAVPAWRVGGFQIMATLVVVNVFQRLWWARRFMLRASR